MDTISFTAPAAENNLFEGRLIADMWRAPTASNDSDIRRYSDNTVEKFAIGALVGTALLAIASRGRGSAVLSQLTESGSSMTKIGHQLLNTEARNSKAVIQAQESVVQHPGVLKDANFGNVARARGSKAAYPVSIADVEATKVAIKIKRIPETKGEIARHMETGQPLSPEGSFHVKYIDEMPVKQLPEFMESGHLSPGIYKMSYPEFIRAFGNGTSRKSLLENFEEALQGLRQGNVKEVHVGGSFVTRKAEPRDIDFIWDKKAKGIDFEFLRGHRQGALLQHDPRLLKDQGLHMLITPPENGTYKGMQNFFANHAVPYQAMRRGIVRTMSGRRPNGIVELDLKTLPGRTGSNIRGTAA